MNAERKKIFLTGGSGFIGRNLQEQFGDKYEFFAPSHSELELTDTKAVKKYMDERPVDVIIHAANIGGDRKTNHLPNIVETNLRIFFNVLLARKPDVKLIFCGSGAEYDKSRDIANVDENNFGQNIPKDVYGFYKYICSKILATLDGVVSFRIFGLYGPHEDRELRFISVAILRALKNKPIEIWQNVKFSYAYIEDFIKVLSFAIENDMKEKFYNIGSGEDMDLLSLAEIVKKVTGSKSEIIVKEPEMNKEYTCNSNLLRKEMGDFSFIDYEEGIKKYFDWLKKYDK
ncbi:MAG: sugar epimerase [Candidatus Harrisonbacteria bacterium CG10_big_fil_rev_8_21_14_0_10_45_28]|uniref:Sugar epimerase n=1 Tax=Candidatus Harrisonbacteria bacterium CG10_big_fil_rev_8_21_14_0_10_45_28 TaxID=1974586 RepID=A0A2H0UMR8_9BACT|nr:MAG: sugar epimerase [Candidatus Harrisonbacteria bacterium CG10_big_fil_rev_8_21_14_0_10_45_28]